MPGEEKSQSNTIPEDESELFGTILAIYDSLKLDLNFLMNWPVTTRPFSICCEKGKGRDASKSLFRNNLEKFNPTNPTNLLKRLLIQMIVLLHQKEDNRKGRVRKINHLSQNLPRAQDWNDFLTVDVHKQQLINLIVDHLLCAIGKAAFVTKDEFSYRTFGSDCSESTFDECIEIPELR